MIPAPSITPAPEQTPPTARQSHYLPTLDGWRAVAIALVVLHHAAPSILAFFGPAVRPFTRFFFVHGAFGVHIFFAVSGLLICTRLLQEHADSSRVSLRNFYVRRAYRILPPLLVFLGIVGLLGATGIVTIKLGQWLSCLFLYANYRPGGTWSLGHFWTLSLEEHFYLTWPLLFALAGPRRALPATIAIAILVGVWRALDMAYFLHPANLTPATLRTDTACDGLLWGAGAALLLARPAIRRFLTRALRPPMFYVLVGLLVASFAYTLPIAFATPVAYSFRAVLMPLLLAATLLHAGSVAGRLLELRPLRYFGRLSYSLYLYQQLFLVWPGLGSPFLGPVQSFPLNLLCAAACAVVSYHLVEKPSIRAGYRRTESRRP